MLFALVYGRYLLHPSLVEDYRNKLQRPDALCVLISYVSLFLYFPGHETTAVDW
jgi:hypothetical protein